MIEQLRERVEKLEEAVARMIEEAMGSALQREFVADRDRNDEGHNLRERLRELETSRIVGARDAMTAQRLSLMRKLDSMDLAALISGTSALSGEDRRKFLDQMLAKGAAASPAEVISKYVTEGESQRQIVAESTSQEAYDKALRTVAEHAGISGDVLRQLIESEARGTEEGGEEG